MLNIVSLAALENYARAIEKLVMQWPACWGLIYAADDAARAERLEKHRRLIEGEAARGRQVPIDWDETRPWSCLFNQLVKDVNYWAEKVHHPAAAWTASGGRGAPTVASENAILSVLPGGLEAQVPESEDRIAGDREIKIGGWPRSARAPRTRRSSSGFGTAAVPATPTPKEVGSPRAKENPKTKLAMRSVSHGPADLVRAEEWRWAASAWGP